VPSTPEDPSRAVLSGLYRLGLLRDSSPVIHGTTVATNAFLQGRGGRTVLITTRGFEDVLALGRQARPHLYRLDPPRRAEWIPSRWRMGVDERMDASGKPYLPLRRRSLQEVVRRVRRLRPDAVAICMLHSYADPAHEKKTAAALRGGGWHVSESHRVAGEFREFERTCTTVANAKLAKPVEGYLEALRRSLGSRRLRIMASSGGWMTASRARRLPVRTLLSGPAGGVCAASLLGKLVSSRDLITLDMGGTSTDLALCLGEVPRVARTSLAGVPLLIPTLDIRSLGAGGGSIARRDAGGALRVGPASAGAQPGPACYARGGKEPTLTDAHLVLGRLPEEGLLGGKLPLSGSHARAALAKLGRSLGMGVEETARGILRVVESSVENSIRSLAAGKGLVPASLALLVFGGAGGLHACALARRLGIGRILVPTDPGAFSALGLASSTATWEASRTVMRRIRRLGRAERAEMTLDLEKEGKAAMSKEGHRLSSLRVVREADARYVGQSHELTLPLVAGFPDRFHEDH
ncbi:MAG TPA: hydantoinase/oxoprolinase family protein, partial [Candidatus Polarisedimenticolia bacterium]|nr:hydantoinase/oxoprolinase family protein [Candidatus Polarisedimenticolia bacterium]